MEFDLLKNYILGILDTSITASSRVQWSTYDSENPPKPGQASDMDLQMAPSTYHVFAQVFQEVDAKIGWDTLEFTREDFCEGEWEEPGSGWERCRLLDISDPHGEENDGDKVG